GNMEIVFGRRAEQRHTTNINLFDGILQSDAFSSDSFLKGIKIADYHVDRCESVLIQRVNVLRSIACQYACMNRRVQGFYPATQHLRHTCQLRNGRNGQISFSQRFFCTATGNEVPTKLNKRSSKFQQSSFVVDTQ